MKRHLLLSVLIFSIALSALAENVLLLTNPTSKETNVFRPGSYIVFELKADNSMHEGYIRDITDSSIVLDYSQVSLSQINIFAGSTKSRLSAGRVANALSHTLLYTGMTVFDCGLDIMLYDDYYYWPVGGTVWLAGAVIAGLGAAFNWALSPPEHAVRVRNYRKWDASIIVEGQPVPEKQIVSPADTIQVQPAPVEPKKEKRKKITEDDVYGD